MCKVLSFCFLVPPPVIHIMVKKSNCMSHLCPRMVFPKLILTTEPFWVAASKVIDWKGFQNIHVMKKSETRHECPLTMCTYIN
jgi:hypothetical protein